MRFFFAKATGIQGVFCFSLRNLFYYSVWLSNIEMASHINDTMVHNWRCSIIYKCAFFIQSHSLITHLWLQQQYNLSNLLRENDFFVFIASTQYKIWTESVVQLYKYEIIVVVLLLTATPSSCERKKRWPENLFGCSCSGGLTSLRRTRKYGRYNGGVDIGVRWRAW